MKGPIREMHGDVLVTDSTYGQGLREIVAAIPAAPGKLPAVVALATKQTGVAVWHCYAGASSRPALRTRVRKVAVAFIVNAARKARPDA